MSYLPGQTLTLKSDEHYVYALIDDDDQVFYVGKSSSPRQRLYQHVQSGTPLVAERLKTVTTPRMRILAGPVSEERATRIESLCIRAGECFCDLVNREAKPPAPPGRTPRCEAVLRFAGIKGSH